VIRVTCITAILAGLLTAVLAVSCASREDGDPAPEGGGEPGRVTQLTGPTDALSEELMLGLALAKNHHHKADVYLKQARIEDAVNEIRQILTVPFPEGAPEGHDVVLDARARLAKLLVTGGKLDQAMEVVDTGIAGAGRESFFLGNLHSVRGEVWEARATSVEEQDPDAARAARIEAIRAFDRAIEIEKGLLEKLSRERKTR
jgi:hypothetical protein